MGFAQHRGERHTVAEYLTWGEDAPRCELIDGVIYDMAAPSVVHQQLVGNLHFELEAHRRSRAQGGGGDGSSSCLIVESPVDVILSDITVVQPDLIVVCRPEIIVDGRVRGAPDLVVEVLSPGTAAKDKKQKRRLYEKAGVSEYLIVDPVGCYVELYILGADGRYPAPEVLVPEDTLTLQAAPGFTLTLSDIFGWPLPIEVRQDIARYG
jgi:Uma2 family endonuclease